MASDGERRFKGLRLHIMQDLGWNAAASLRAFGFAPCQEPVSDEQRRVIVAEAERTGRVSDGHPHSSWRAEIRSPEGRLGERLADIDRMMAERMDNELWGETPGGPSHLLATYVRKSFGEKVEATPQGLDSLELFLVQRTPGAIRWIPSVIFQALADFVGVVAAHHFGVKVSWAEAEDLGDGYGHPPLFRTEIRGEQVPVPLGQPLLRWCMMPILDGEELPPLSAWAEDQFGGADAQ